MLSDKQVQYNIVSSYIKHLRWLSAVIIVTSLLLINTMSVDKEVNLRAVIKEAEKIERFLKSIKYKELSDYYNKKYSQGLELAAEKDEGFPSLFFEIESMPLFRYSGDKFARSQDYNVYYSISNMCGSIECFSRLWDSIRYKYFLYDGYFYSKKVAAYNLKLKKWYLIDVEKLYSEKFLGNNIYSISASPAVEDNFYPFKNEVSFIKKCAKKYNLFIGQSAGKAFFEKNRQYLYVDNRYLGMMFGFIDWRSSYVYCDYIDIETIVFLNVFFEDRFNQYFYDFASLLEAGELYSFDMLPKFREGFRLINSFSQENNVDSISAIKEVATKKLKEIDSNISGFGVKLTASFVSIWGWLGIVALQIYFLIHLKEMFRWAYEKEYDKELSIAPWAALYRSKLSYFSFVLATILMPAAVIIAMLIKMHIMDYQSYYIAGASKFDARGGLVGVAGIILTSILAWLQFKTLHYHRKLAFSKSDLSAANSSEGASSPHQQVIVNQIDTTGASETVPVKTDKHT